MIPLMPERGDLIWTYEREVSAQRMALANAGFKIDITEKGTGPLVLASHPPTSAQMRNDRITSRFLSPATFSTAC
jgi:hypothetical protein